MAEGLLVSEEARAGRLNEQMATILKGLRDDMPATPSLSRSVARRCVCRRSLARTPLFHPSKPWGPCLPRQPNDCIPVGSRPDRAWVPGVPRGCPTHYKCVVGMPRTI